MITKTMRTLTSSLHFANNSQIYVACMGVYLIQYSKISLVSIYPLSLRSHFLSMPTKHTSKPKLHERLCLSVPKKCYSYSMPLRRFLLCRYARV